MNCTHFETRDMNRISREDGTMAHRILRLVAFAAAFLATGSCVQTRPSRNAVLNENQYVRKDFLVGAANSTTPDPGWWLKGTIVQTSTPNPLGSSTFGLSPGIDSGAIPIRFVITEDKLQMVSTREESATDPQSPEVTPAVVNAWPIQNVDLMYYVNLDGELTNQYVVNQEAPWQQREWVQVNFDKNDMADLAPLGEATWNLLSNCVDQANVSTTLVPNSFIVDEANNYMQWTVSVTLPLIWDDPNCTFAYGDLGQEAAALGKESVTFNLMYSLERMKPLNQVTYKPLTIAEKDPIQHKYGFLQNITQNLDPNTGMLAGQEQVIRFDPTKPIVWYFSQGFDEAYKHFFTDPNTGIVDRTNAVLEAAGSAKNCGTAQASGNCVEVHDYDYSCTGSNCSPGTVLAQGQGPRQYGDIRYNFLTWMSDQFSQETFAGVTIPVVDYRTGESMAANIAFNTFAFQDFYLQRVNDYLLSIGAYGTDNGQAYNLNTPGEWPTEPTFAEPLGVTDPTTDPNLVNCTVAAAQNSCPITVTYTDATTNQPTSETLNCYQGSTLPIESVVDAAVHNGTSTVFGKMQDYLGEPSSIYGNLGPANFIAPTSQTNDPDFFNAYYTLLPYIVYTDPTMNPYVVPEGGNGTFGPPTTTDAWTDLQNEVAFQNWAAQLNAGQDQGLTGANMPNGWPYNYTGAQGGVVAAAAGASTFRNLDQMHHDYQYHLMQRNMAHGMHLDGLDSLSFESQADQVARSCGVDTAGAWQTKEQWVSDLTSAYWNQVFIHEFGHSLGLQHNFMGSLDAPHYEAFPVGVDSSGNPATQAECDQNPIQQGCVPVTHTSSVMEYNAYTDRLEFHTPDWGEYDKGAIAWIYANNSADGTPPNGTACQSAGCSISGQNSATSPWNDPMGFDSSGNEMKFLFCDEYHEKYTPLCKPDDMGRTPSEITANALDTYEWQYQWRNLRNYHKYWDDSTYANTPDALFSSLQKFVSMWAFDWSNTEIAVELRRIGITNPCEGDVQPSAQCPIGGQSDQDYYNQLSNKFESEVSASSQMAAAYHIAMINQAYSERPAATTYDPYYGDVEQQGIILDKYFAMQDFAGLWPVTNYDPTQSAGAYLTWYGGVGDTAFNNLAEWGVTTMLGGVINVFPYFQPTTVALFAQDTHDPAFDPVSPFERDWIGGHQFSRLEDFLAYFQEIAVDNQYTGMTGCVDQTADATQGQAVACNCITADTCTYDPRNIPDPQNANEFVGPDGKRYIWAKIQDRQQWVVAEQDRNIVTNTLLYEFNLDVVAGQDDGNFPGGAYEYELPIKFTADSFTYFN
ncbi:MAG TPA: hypothetical protein VMB50_00925 [Myxococcales bacterium]|nr:hypothetical protein [Myxococcales bacterium]